MYKYIIEKYIYIYIYIYIFALYICHIYIYNYVYIHIILKRFDRGLATSELHGLILPPASMLLPGPALRQPCLALQRFCK